MQWQNPRFFPYINLLMFYIYCTQIGNKIRPKLPYIKTLIILLKNKIYIFFYRIFFHTFLQSVYLATTRRIAQIDDSRLELFSSLIEYFFPPQKATRPASPVAQNKLFGRISDYVDFIWIAAAPTTYPRTAHYAQNNMENNKKVRTSIRNT